MASFKYFGAILLIIGFFAAIGFIIFAAIIGIKRFFKNAPHVDYSNLQSEGAANGKLHKVETFAESPQMVPSLKSIKKISPYELIASLLLLVAIIGILAYGVYYIRCEIYFEKDNYQFINERLIEPIIKEKYLKQNWAEKWQMIDDYLGNKKHRKYAATIIESLVIIGIPGSEPIIINIFKKYIDEKEWNEIHKRDILVDYYLNSGNEELERMAKDWAKAHGFAITTSYRSKDASPAKWGR